MKSSVGGEEGRKGALSQLPLQDTEEVTSTSMRTWGPSALVTAQSLRTMGTSWGEKEGEVWSS